MAAINATLSNVLEVQDLSANVTISATSTDGQITDANLLAALSGWMRVGGPKGFSADVAVGSHGRAQEEHPLLH